MNHRLLRHLTMVVASTMSFALVMSASAQYEFKQADNAQPVVQENSIPESPNGIYVVQMKGDPVVAYDGSIKGLKATKPAKGKKIDPNSQDVKNYVKHLNRKHSDALRHAKGGKKVYNYQYSFNGFAAKMTHAQAKKMQSVDGVVRVYADEPRSLDTATTPDFLNLTAPDGLYDMGVKGEDIIIGIVDGGIWPESLSFTDRTGSNGNNSKDGKLDYQQIPGWHGKCTPGEAFNASHCNQKLIGATYYNSGFGGNAGIDANLPWEFNSPRDFGGHGTHTASTAGGNSDTPLTGTPAVLGSISGIAPRARIAAYKVCWQTPSGGSCYPSDSVAAIDQAVADGVDVINFSISGSRTNFLDSVEVAFLFAADAGVFVAASAGNSGPGASTVAHPGPWLTTVAASTHDRYYEADLMLGDGQTFTGASTNQTGAGPADLVYSANALDPAYVHDDDFDGAIATAEEAARLCVPGSLDPAVVAGNIVLCDRGVFARVDKSLAVFMAGGVGSFLANPNPGMSLNADFHSVPTVHVDNIAGDAIRAYANGGGTPTAEIFPSVFSPADAPFIAGFSSRGPLLAGGGDLLKPDVSAPGVDIMAAVAPPGNGGESFASYQGTSMSSPHVAGLAALLKEMHPDWSPMMIKSALMTTGYDLLSGADPFAQGGGHVDPNSAADPGLVYDHGFLDWLGFLCGTGQLQASYCPALGFDPSDLNMPSIAIGSLIGSQTVTRTVTNVGDTAETYTFSSSVPGIDIVASPSSFTIAPGATQTFELTLNHTTATPNAYATGSVYWSSANHMVRSPVAVVPIVFSADAEVFGSGTDGSTSIEVTFGYDGTYTAEAHGLDPAYREDGNVEDDPGNSFQFFGPGTSDHYFYVPTGTKVARWSLYNEYTDGNDDLDLYVWRCEGFACSQVGGSGNFDSNESVTLILPEPAADIGAGDVYIVFVHGWQTDGPDANYTLFNWVVDADAGNMTVNGPASATFGATESVDVEWTGLDADEKYLGGVSHSDDVGVMDVTVVTVDTD